MPGASVCNRELPWLNDKASTPVRGDCGRIRGSRLVLRNRLRDILVMKYFGNKKA